MFGQRQRHTTEILELLRQEVANDVRAHTAIAEAMSSVHATLVNDVHEIERSSATTDVAVEHLWRKVIQQEQALTAAVEHLAQVCAALTMRIDAEARERRALIETVTRVATGVTARPRIIGGSVYATDGEPPGDRLFSVGRFDVELGSAEADVHAADLATENPAASGPWHVAVEHGS